MTNAVAVKIKTSGLTVRPHPLRSHAVAGQISGHDVQEPGHRGRPREGQDRDGGEVLDGAEYSAQVLVGEVGQRPPVGAAPRLEFFGRDEHHRRVD